MNMEWNKFFDKIDTVYSDGTKVKCKIYKLCEIFDPVDN